MQLLFLLLMATSHCLYSDTTNSSVSMFAPSASPSDPSIDPSRVRAEHPRLKTDAPMLGYIFDTHSTLTKHHHHHTHEWGPHFEEEPGTTATNITVQSGDTANLDCRISLLQDKMVSWVRRREELQLLTVGHLTYSGDSRYSAQFQYPNNWRLKISRVDKAVDEGSYECQISTHPPKVTTVHLHVNAPEVLIVDDQGQPVYEKFYEEDSTIQLDCIVRHVSMTSSVVNWLHEYNQLNYDTTRGGISVKTDLTEEGANSSLSVARVTKQDTGNYTCSISSTEFAAVYVHVLQGESLAELHHGNQGCPTWLSTASLVQVGLVLLLSTS